MWRNERMMNRKFLRWSSLALGILTVPLIAAENWPSWRGPGSNGVVPGKQPPLELDGKLLWKVELPGRGCSTPIVWENRIFVTSPVGDQDGVVAYDAAGKELWRQTFGAITPGRGQRVGSAANSSPITDGEIVVAYFKSGTVACLDLDGKTLWQVNLQEKYGEDTLWWDQGTSPVFTKTGIAIAVMQTGGESYLVTLDRKTGAEIWRTPRKYDVAEESGDSYTTPHVIELDGVEQIVCWGADHLTGHDAATGKLIWESGGFNPNRTAMQRVIASAVVENGIAVVPFNRGDSLGAVRLGGTGDISKNWLWRDDKVGSDAVSPVLRDGKLYVLKDGGRERGRVTCIDAATGKHLWESELPKAAQVYYASPVIAGDRMFCVREDGFLISGRIGENGLEEVKTHSLDEGVIASPISANGRLYVRGDKHLFCFGEQ